MQLSSLTYLESSETSQCPEHIHAIWYRQINMLPTWFIIKCGTEYGIHMTSVLLLFERHKT